MTKAMVRKMSGVILSGDEPPGFGQMSRQMNKLLEQVQKGFFSYCPAETWSPAVNLYENDVAYLVCVDLAGVEKEKIDVLVHNNQLKLRGHRNVPTVPEEVSGPEGPMRVARMRVHLMEIDNGPFCREVDLPEDVDQGSISATHSNGMLWITLPKSRPSSP